jgi:hypothetical protein
VVNFKEVLVQVHLFLWYVLTLQWEVFNCEISCLSYFDMSSEIYIKGVELVPQLYLHNWKRIQFEWLISLIYMYNINKQEKHFTFFIVYLEKGYSFKHNKDPAKLTMRKMNKLRIRICIINFIYISYKYTSIMLKNNP